MQRKGPWGVLRLLLVLGACGLWPVAQSDGKQTRIAVVDLDSQGEQAQAYQLGKTASQILTAEFVKQGRFDVIERQALEKVVTEQQLGATGILDTESAAKLGRVLGAGYMVTGALISHKQGADMVVKIIETETASIKVADTLSGPNPSAVFKKVPEFVARLSAHFPIRGLIIFEKEGLFTLDLGKRSGVASGMVFEVFQEGEPIKHPVTGEILGLEKTAIGQIQITEARENLAYAKVLKLEPGKTVAAGQQVISHQAADVKRGGFAGLSAGAGGSSGSLRFDIGWGRKGAGTGDFILPYGLAADAEGNVFVADTHNNRIQVFSNTGSFLRAWGQAGAGQGSFAQPMDVAVDAQGDVYVADTNNFRIQKFDATGRFLFSWGQRGTGNGDFVFLTGIAVGQDGNLYATDAKMNRLQVFDPQGRYVRSWGQKGKGSGSFAVPMGVAVDDEGNVYVADSKMRRVQKFSASGQYVASFADKLAYPTDVAFDRTSGNLFVLDGAGCNFMEFSPNGQNVRTFGGPGTGNGQFLKPNGITVDASGNVFVADTENCRVQKFSR